jgi:hypothetical protein
MSNFKKVSVAIFTVLSVGAVFAEPSLQQIQSQLDQLNSKVSALQPASLPGNALQSSPTLSKIGKFAEDGSLDLDNDDGFYIDAQPSVTYELALLQAQQQHSFDGVAFGGYFEQDTQYWNGDTITTTDNTLYSHGSGVYFTSLNLDFLARMNPWTSVLVRAEVQNLGTTSESIGLHDGFVTFGNLDKLPLYATIGKTYVPFGGFYGSGLWNAALTRVAFRPSTTNQVIFGYYEKGLGTSLSFFHNPGFGSQVSRFAYRFSYGNSSGKWSYGAGLGYLSDMRGNSSSVGSQFSSGGAFYNAQNTRNAVYDINGTIGYGIVEVDGEFLTTQRNLITTAGANQGRPQAWNIDASVSPVIYGKPVSMMVGYSHTSHLQGTPMGLNGAAAPGYSTASGLTGQWTATVSREILSGYYLGLEGSQNKLYNGQKTYEFTVDNSVYF